MGSSCMVPLAMILTSVLSANTTVVTRASAWTHRDLFIVGVGQATQNVTSTVWTLMSAQGFTFVIPMHSVMTLLDHITVSARRDFTEMEATVKMSMNAHQSFPWLATSMQIVQTYRGHLTVNAMWAILVTGHCAATSMSVVKQSTLVMEI